MEKQSPSRSFLWAIFSLVSDCRCHNQNQYITNGIEYRIREDPASRRKTGHAKFKNVGEEDFSAQER